ncbi:hypothetical protein HJG60_008854 [Phyllostomus discolor]|uniref:Uncharacterized protein n=1 Tax=Phyllostomus discolor TaxID=89673 RepID=A0A833YWG8_9CHIR|nr:hypothetical protein HJG60_008854 [Phyllostomus discolor]
MNDSCLQRPVPNSPATASCMESKSPRIWPFSFPAIFCFPSTTVFPKEACLLMMYRKQDSSSSVTFATSDVSGLMCYRTYLFIFQDVQGIYRTLLQDRISNETFPLAISLCHHNFFLLYLVTGNTRMWMILALVSNDTSLLLLVFPNSSTATLPSFSLLLTSWLHSPLEMRTNKTKQNKTKTGSKVFHSFSVLLSMLKVCISSVIMIFVSFFDIQMQSCFGAFFFHFYQNSFQIFATFCQ